MMGESYGVISPVKTFAETLYFEADLKAGQTLELPNAEERGVYVAAGQIEINGQAVNEFSLAVLENIPTIRVKAREDSRIALIGGEALGERHMFWNFVSSSKARIERAKSEWRDEKFPLVPGDEAERIPLPE